MRYPPESIPEVTVKETSPIRTDARTISLIVGTAIALTFAGAVAWASVKADVAEHTQQLVRVQSTLGADHDESTKHTAQIAAIEKTLEKMDKKLDYLTGARTDRPEPH